MDNVRNRIHKLRFVLEDVYHVPRGILNRIDIERYANPRETFESNMNRLIRAHPELRNYILPKTPQGLMYRNTVIKKGEKYPIKFVPASRYKVNKTPLYQRNLFLNESTSLMDDLKSAIKHLDRIAAELGEPYKSYYHQLNRLYKDIEVTIKLDKNRL